MVVHMIESNDMKHFESQVVNRKYKAVVVMFSSPRCGPCQTIAPQYEQMSNTYRQFKFLKVDCTKAPMISYTMRVGGLPTFMVFKSGKKVSTICVADIQQLQRVCSQI